MATKRGKQSDHQRDQQARAREKEQQRKNVERKRLAEEKEKKHKYIETRKAEVDRKNLLIKLTVRELKNILSGNLNRSARQNLKAARYVPDLPRLNPERKPATPPKIPLWENLDQRPPGKLRRAFGGMARYEKRVAAAREQYDKELLDTQAREVARQQQETDQQRRHETETQAIREAAKKQNEVLDAHIKGFAAHNKADVEWYYERVLNAVPLPRNFSHEVEVVFHPSEEEVLARFALPERKLMPTFESYTYVQTKDEQRPKARKAADLAALYRDVISQVALLCVRDLFNSDPVLNCVGFNGHIHATNPATGEEEYPCIISLKVERSDFPVDRHIKKVISEACIRNLNSIVSNHPYDLEPIEPIIDFDIAKFSFVEGFDAIATLDSRPDLMDMSPTNFEHLVRQVFEAQGAEGWTTQQSNDDGVDAVIRRPDTILGGIIGIVQAKRYRNPVGPNHIRELAGAMEEKKAGYGILVTTSKFTKRSEQKAREHGRMQLIDGNELKYLIKEHLGKDVLISIPEKSRKRNTPPGDSDTEDDPKKSQRPGHTPLSQ